MCWLSEEQAPRAPMSRGHLNDPIRRAFGRVERVFTIPARAIPIIQMKLSSFYPLRPFKNPPIETVGEAVEFFRQVLEGGPFSFFCLRRTDIFFNRVSSLSINPV